MLLFSAQTIFGAELFTINNSNTIVATKDSANTIGLVVDQISYQEILEKEVVDFVGKIFTICNHKYNT